MVLSFFTSLKVIPIMPSPAPSISIKYTKNTLKMNFNNKKNFGLLFSRSSLVLAYKIKKHEKNKKLYILTVLFFIRINISHAQEYFAYSSTEEVIKSTLIEFVYFKDKSPKYIKLLKSETNIVKFSKVKFGDTTYCKLNNYSSSINGKYYDFKSYSKVFIYLF
jgi:hypothetical protein